MDSAGVRRAALVIGVAGVAAVAAYLINRYRKRKVRSKAANDVSYAVVSDPTMPTESDKPKAIKLDRDLAVEVLKAQKRRTFKHIMQLAQDAKVAQQLAGNALTLNQLRQIVLEETTFLSDYERTKNQTYHDFGTTESEINAFYDAYLKNDDEVKQIYTDLSTYLNEALRGIDPIGTN
jgi:hypothetical protein